jgi:hypothetical protein
VSQSDFFALVSAMFLARAVTPRFSLWACWAFLGIALLKRWAA